jgi:hypothetical protein
MPLHPLSNLAKLARTSIDAFREVLGGGGGWAYLLLAHSFGLVPTSFVCAHHCPRLSVPAIALVHPYRYHPRVPTCHSFMPALVCMRPRWRSFVRACIRLHQHPPRSFVPAVALVIVCITHS